MKIDIKCPKCGRKLRADDVATATIYCPNDKCCDKYGELENQIFVTIYNRGWQQGRDALLKEFRDKLGCR